MELTQNILRLQMEITIAIISRKYDLEEFQKAFN